MRRLISLAAATALLALAGCGDDEDSASGEGTSGATGVQSVSPSDAGMTAGEFIDAPIPGQVEAIQDLVAENDDCSDVDAKPGSEFQVGVAINAAQADPDTPLSEIVADSC